MSVGRIAHLVAPVLCLVIASLASAAGATCKALVLLNDRWYVSDEAGTLSAPFIGDAKRASGVSLSDDGEHVGYLKLGINNHDEFYIAGKSGEPYHLVEKMEAGARFPGIRWMGDDVIRTEVGYRVTSGFKFYRIASGNEGIRLTRIPKSGAGAACAINPRATRVACIEGYRITVNNKDFYVQESMEHIPIIDRFDVKQGEWHGIRFFGGGDDRGQPVFVKAESDHRTIHISVQYGNIGGPRDGPEWWGRTSEFNWLPSVDGEMGISVSRTPDGKTMPVEVRLRDDGSSPFDPAVAWPPDGQAFAFVEHTEEGPALVTLRQGSANKWTKSGQYPFGRSGTADAIRFLDDSTLFVESDGHAALYSLTTGSRTNGPNAGLRFVRALPREIEVKGKDGPVSVPPISWACR